MKATHLFFAVMITSLLFFAFSIFPSETYLMKKCQIYLSSSEEKEIKITNFGGEIKIILKGKNENSTLIYLDGNRINSEKWIKTSIGIHKVIIKTSSESNLELSILSRGYSFYIQFSFAMLTIISSLGIFFFKFRGSWSHK